MTKNQRAKVTHQNHGGNHNWLIIFGLLLAFLLDILPRMAAQIGDHFERYVHSTFSKLIFDQGFEAQAERRSTECYIAF